MDRKEALSNQHSAISQNENQEHRQQQRQNQREELFTPELRAEELALTLAETYEELTRLLERNPGIKRRITEGAAKEDKVYQKLKQRLKLADMTPRCRWVRQDGTTCGSPQMRQHIYCFAHKQMMEARALALRLPAPEDANAIQVGLMRIQKALIEDTISTKKAGLLLYSMQLALTNVGQTTFGQAKDEELVQETVEEQEAFSNQHSAVSEKAVSNQQSAFSQKQNQRPFTTEGTEDTEGSKTLPLMNADERGLEKGGKQSEWKPKADMYRMDTREGMEAYEASFRMKINSAVTGKQRPAEPVMAPEDTAQTHAILG